MVKKIGIFIIVITLLILMIIPVQVKAFDLKGDITDYIEKKEKPEPVQSEALTNTGKSIAGVVKYIGIFISVITLSVLGIKYMAGGIEEKAQYKETMMPYLIGAIIIFASSFIVEKIYEIVTMTI